MTSAARHRAPSAPRHRAPSAPRARAPRRRAGRHTLLALALCGLGVVAALPAGAAPITATAGDTFSRTGSGGWGTADTGGSWSAGPSGSFAVSGGVGTVGLTPDGHTRQATLPGSGTMNDLTVTLSASRTPTGGGLYVSVIGRRVATAGQYQAKVRIRPDGAVAVALSRTDVRWAETSLTGETVVPGVQAADGRQIRVRLEVAGTAPTTLRAKVWQAGAAEPAGWTASATDSASAWQAAGGVGLFSYLSRGSVPLTLRVDDVAASLVAGASTPLPNNPGPSNPPPDSPPPNNPPPMGGNTGARETGGAGAVAVGAARYAVPAGALFVSPSGSDAGNGSPSAPWRTVARAIAAAPSGATVVLRQGSYRESVQIPSGKRLTLQPYPGEAVWFDGSRLVTGWTADGSAWRVNGWTPQFDNSPTYTKGASDNKAAYWGFVNSAYPMAAYPDMVFLDGVAQRQVGSRGAVVPGTFYVDTGGDRLYLGSNPAGKTVHASALSTALTIRGGGSVVRGIGVQRYATSVPEKGALISFAPDVTLENVVVRDNATQGIFVGGMNLGVRNVLRNVTLERNGMLGVEASYSDGLVVDGMRAVGNNTERFNTSPVSGGMKITRSRGLTVADSVFADNIGTGLWFDESVYNATVTGNDLLRNAGHGLSYEISSKALIADNLVARNGGLGLKINNASNIDIWNNTVVDNGDRPIWLVQDPRVASNPNTPGRDPRQKQPDPTVTWLLGPITVKNNVIGGTTGGNCLLCVQDSALKRTAGQIAVTANGNAYHRTSAGSPKYSVTWPAGQGNPKVFTTLAAFRSGTGQEAQGTEFVGAPVVDGSYRITPAVRAVEGAAAQPLPSAVAGPAGRPVGQERLGAQFD